jgi:hypothetical protein
MLNREKLTLAAEVLRRPAQAVSDERQTVDEDCAGVVVSDEEETRHPRRWLVAVPLVASAIAASTYFVSVPEARAWLAAVGLG